ncbi:hypothetical protein [Borrelia persica]|uniref:hypothetical protein n=1 Tax=Borrelia persica TaxID=44448 RepID=UPI0004656696|nr:hypothetical protein [Borrelia persica]
MSVIKNINKLLDTVTAKDFLLQGFGDFVEESNVNVAREGIVLASSILSFICLIKDKIVKQNEDKRAIEIINSRLKGAVDLAIDACEALEDGENWDDYDKLIQLRGQVAKEILNQMKKEY